MGKATSRVQVGAHQDRGAAQSETTTRCDVQDHHSGSQVSTSEAGRSAHHTGAANMEDKEKDRGVQWQYAGLFGAAWILFPVASFWTQLALSVVVCVFVSWFGGTGSAIASTRMVAASTVKKTRTSKQQRVKLKWGRVFELMVEHGLAGEEARLHQQVQRLESALQVERDKRREDFQRHIEAAGKNYGIRTLTTILSLWHPYMIYKALINADAGIRRERIRPTRRDYHGGRSDECICLSRACIACRHYAIDSITYNPLTRQEARGVNASFKGLRVHSAHKG